MNKLFRICTALVILIWQAIRGRLKFQINLKEISWATEFVKGHNSPFERIRYTLHDSRRNQLRAYSSCAARCAMCVSAIVHSWFGSVLYERPQKGIDSDLEFTQNSYTLFSPRIQTCFRFGKKIELNSKMRNDLIARALVCSPFSVSLFWISSLFCCFFSGIDILSYFRTQCSAVLLATCHAGI